MVTGWLACWLAVHVDLSIVKRSLIVASVLMLLAAASVQSHCRHCAQCISCVIGGTLELEDNEKLYEEVGDQVKWKGIERRPD